MGGTKLGLKAEGSEYELLRDALALVESSGNPSLEQRSTKAKGYFQFIPRYWNKWVQDNTGRSLRSFMPNDSSPEEMARSAREQKEILFPLYYEKEMAPWVQRMRRKGFGKGRSDLELATMFHKLGAGPAEKYLRSGYDASAGTPDNEPIEQYISKVSSAAARTPGARLATLLKGARFRDPRLEGRQAQPGEGLGYFEDKSPAARQASRALKDQGHAPSPTQPATTNPARANAATQDVRTAAQRAEIASLQTLHGRSEYASKNDQVLSSLRQLAGLLSADQAGAAAIDERVLARLRREGQGL